MKKDHILQQMDFSPETGSLHFNGVRYMVVRPETLCSVQKLAEEEFGESGANILFKSGRVGGKLSTERYRDLFSLSDLEAVNYMCEMGAQIGWGKFRLERFDPDSGKIVVTVHHSPFAEAYGASEKAVCHFIRGIVSGMAEAVFGRPTDVVETECSACDDAHCTFETR